MLKSPLQGFLQLIPDWKQYALFYILLALVVGFLVGRYRAYRSFRFQNRGESLLSRVALKHFRPPDYHLMNHVTLPIPGGTTQIDHILVSRFGVFVIETKDYKGWIVGNEKQATWTQVLFNAKFKFQNPIRQNFLHVSAVQNLLDFLPPGAVKSVVVFTGDAEFPNDMPQGVYCGLSEFVGFVRQQTAEAMSINRVQFCVGRLETARLGISRETDVEHVQNILRMHGRND